MAQVQQIVEQYRPREIVGDFISSHSTMPQDAWCRAFLNLLAPEFYI
jgi:hypothetical protein